MVNSPNPVGCFVALPFGGAFFYPVRYAGPCLCCLALAGLPLFLLALLSCIAAAPRAAWCFGLAPIGCESIYLLEYLPFVMLLLLSCAFASWCLASPILSMCPGVPVMFICFPFLYMIATTKETETALQLCVALSAI